MFWHMLRRTSFPVGLYGCLFLLRKHWSPYGCHEAAERCFSLPLLPADSWVKGPFLEQADFFSTLTQNATGLLAVALPLWIEWMRCQPLQKSCLKWKEQATLHLGLFLQVAFWNGVGVECARLFLPRLRPYGRIALEAHLHDFLSYSSFYSGHTSFTAAASTFLIFSLCLIQKARPLALSFSLSASFLLVFLTAFFRILAGKHFLSDVATAIGMGSIVACVVFLSHQAWCSKNNSLHNTTGK